MNLSKVMQSIYHDLGMSETFLATGGSATTVENTNLSDLEEQPDDGYAIDYTIFIANDAGGAGASPEGKFSRVSDYVASTNIYTIDTVIDAVAAGDEIMLCTNEIPLREMIRSVNRGLEEIGPVAAVPDTSLTTGSDQTEYTLPAAIMAGDIKNVFYQARNGNSNDNSWTAIEWSVEQGVYGSTGTIFLPQVVEGRTVKIIYDGIHSKLTAWNSEIASSIPERLAIAAGSKYALRWYVNNNEGGDDFWKQRYNEAALDFEEGLRKLRRQIRQIHGMPHWAREKFYYPGDQSIFDK